MSHKLEIEINATQEKVFDYLCDNKNRSKWWPDCEAIDSLEGKEGEEGSTYKVLVGKNKFKSEVIETIIRKQRPKELFITQESSVGLTENRFYLTSNGPQKSTWSWEWYMELNDPLQNLSAKIMTFLMSGSIKRPIMEAMEKCKKAIEGEK